MFVPAALSRFVRESHHRLGFRQVSTHAAKFSWSPDQATFPLRPLFMGCRLVAEVVDFTASHLGRLAL